MTATTKKTVLTEQELYELTQAEMKLIAGGRPKQGEGLLDLVMWVACGFNHHYVPTGKTKKDVDLCIPITLYEVRCRDCGYYTWKRMTKNEAYVQGPKIDPNAMPLP